LDEEPVTVRELLSEIKDTSELAVYLAYSALMFRDRTIADEVSELEERMDDLRSSLRLATMLAVRNVDDAQQVRPLLRVSSAANRIAMSAGEIAELLQRGMDIHPMIFEALDRSEEKVARCRVSEESELAGMRLGEADLESNAGMMVIAMRKPDGRWIWGPEDQERVDPGSVLIAKGPGDGSAILREIAGGRRGLHNMGEVG
jgi:uncharacterized protein with PhoU and TrkA domain